VLLRELGVRKPVRAEAAGSTAGSARVGRATPWSTYYVGAYDLQAVLDRAESMGAKTVMPITGFGGVVTIALFRDLDGLPVGLVNSAGPGHAQEGASSLGGLPANRWTDSRCPAVTPGSPSGSTGSCSAGRSAYPGFPATESLTPGLAAAFRAA